MCQLASAAQPPPVKGQLIAQTYIGAANAASRTRATSLASSYRCLATGAAHVREGRSRPLEGGRRLAHALGRHALKGLGADWFSSLVDPPTKKAHNRQLIKRLWF